MEKIHNKVKEILKEIDNNFKDEKEAEFAKTKVLELYEVFADELEEIEETCSNRIDVITAKYSMLDSRIEGLQDMVDRIQKDIYVEDEYDLDIVCPYCDAEFTIDTSDELKNSVVCPECNNVIELDWNDEDEGCGHDCSGCHHDCGSDDDETDENEDDM